MLDAATAVIACAGLVLSIYNLIRDRQALDLVIGARWESGSNRLTEVTVTVVNASNRSMAVHALSLVPPSPLAPMMMSTEENDFPTFVTPCSIEAGGVRQVALPARLVWEEYYDSSGDLTFELSWYRASVRSVVTRRSRPATLRRSANLASMLANAQNASSN